MQIWYTCFLRVETIWKVGMPLKNHIASLLWKEGFHLPNSINYNIYTSKSLYLSIIGSNRLCGQNQHVWWSFILTFCTNLPLKICKYLSCPLLPLMSSWFLRTIHLKILKSPKTHTWTSVCTLTILSSLEFSRRVF